jgi:hypothetical protein
MRYVRLLVLSILLALLLQSAAIAAIRFHNIRYDPPGADYRTAGQLRAEYIILRNTGNRAKNLQGWVVKDRAGHRFLLPDYRLGPDKYVKIHTGSGRDRRGDIYWAPATSSGTTTEMRQLSAIGPAGLWTSARIPVVQAPTHPSAADAQSRRASQLTS